MFGELTMVKEMSVVLYDIYIYYDDSDLVVLENFGQSVFTPYYPGVRAKLDINEHLQGKNIRKIVFYTVDSDEYSVELQIDDKTWDTHRPLYINKIRQRRTSIKIEKNECSFKHYFISMSQDIFSEDDESKGCKKYPNEMFESYNDCDEAYAKSTVNQMIQNYCTDASDKGLFPDTFVPIYATHNLSLVTELQVIPNCSVKFKYGSNDLMTGAMASSCAPPCTTTTTTKILTDSEHNYACGITLYFDKSIMVTNVTLDQFQPLVSLNFLGSNLGLWPGLGICQLFEWFLENVLSRIRIQDIVGQMKVKMVERFFNAGK